MQKLNYWKTTYKTIEPPVFIILAAQAAGKFLDIDPEISNVAAVAVYGLFCGIRNAIKNRRSR